MRGPLATNASSKKQFKNQYTYAKMESKRSETSPSFSPRKILVTGAAGFILSNLVDLLLEQFPDVQVVGYDLMVGGSNARNLEDAFRTNRFTLVKGDIRNLGVLINLLRTHQFDSVIHGAAESNVDKSFLDPARFISTNITGTFCVLQSIKLYNEERNKQGLPGIRRTVCFATDEIYGSTSEEHTETSVLRPTTNYSWTKAATPMIMSSFFHSYKMHVNAVLPSNAFGPKQVEKLIPKWCHLLIRKRKLCVHGDGSVVRSWLYVKDLCRGVVAVLQKGRAGECYNIGTSEELPVIDVAHLILSEFGIPEEEHNDHIDFHRDRLQNDSAYRINSDKVKKDCGWSASTPFKEAFQETVAWYKANQNFWEPDETSLQAHPVASTCHVPESVEYIH